MNDKEKVWKKLTDNEMQVDNFALPRHAGHDDRQVIAAIDELKEIFDNSYRLHQITVVVDPNTFEPVTTFHIALPSGKNYRLYADIMQDGVNFRTNPEDVLLDECR